MSKRHYVITTRPVHKVTVENLRDQFWYEHDKNQSADVASPFMRCGRYVDNNGVAVNPDFFDPGTEDRDFGIADHAPFEAKGGSLEQFDLLFAELELQKKDLLLFVFGFENDTRGELEHLEILHKEYVAPEGAAIGRVMMLSWPSQGLLKYNDEIRREGKLGAFFKKLFGSGKPVDENLSDAAITGRVFAVWLLKLQHYMQQRYANAAPGVYRPRLNLITQSMANHVLRFTAAEITRLNKKDTVKGLFENLLLTSPDIRNNIFETDENFRDAAAFAKKTWLVFSPQDPTLKMGDTFYPYRDPRSGVKKERLGKTGPETDIGLPPNLFKVCVQQHDIRSKLSDYNHRYFEFNSTVIQLYRSIFSGTAVTGHRVVEA